MSQVPDIMPELYDHADYRLFLKAYYDRKKAASPQWSYKSWAKQLGLKSSSTLIMIVNGERNPGTKLTVILATFFQFDEERTHYFTSLVRLQRARSQSSDNKQLIEILRQKVGGRDPLVGLAASALAERMAMATISFDPAKLETAKQFIDSFVTDFCQRFEEKSLANSYRLDIAFMPIQER